MKVTEQHLISLDNSIDMLEAIIDHLERPTKHSRARIEEWLEKHPKQLRSALVDHRHELEAEYSTQQTLILVEGGKAS